jgi:ABC-type glycerol-3-phosphate transport system substrate-binding protein
MNNTKTQTTRRLTCAAAIAGSLALAACGGSNGDDPVAAPAPTTQFVPGTQVPVAATTSVAGVIAFLQGLIAGTSDNGDPIAVGDAVLATSETDDATPL